MIVESTFDNKPCMLAYFDEEMQACEPEEATIVKVIFEDGSNIFLSPDELASHG